MNFTHAIPASTFSLLASWLHAAVTDRARPTRAKVHMRCGEMAFTRNQIRELKSPLGVTMECLSGQVWITLDGDSRDVVLGAGQVFTVDRDKRTLLMALDEAAVRCTFPAST